MQSPGGLRWQVKQWQLSQALALPGPVAGPGRSDGPVTEARDPRAQHTSSGASLMMGAAMTVLGCQWTLKPFPADKSVRLYFFCPQKSCPDGQDLIF